MMGYLDRLKGLDPGKQAPSVLQELQKAPSYSFCSAQGAHFQKIQAENQATFRWWLIHFADREPVEVSICPPENYAQVLAIYPGAIAAEPIPETSMPIPTASMTAEQEAAIRAWLAHIEETDSAVIAEVLDTCRADAAAREYFILRAAEVPPKTGKEIER